MVTGAAQIHLLDKGRVMAEYGPMQLVISAVVGEVPQVEECVRAAKESFCYLGQVAKQLKRLSLPWHRISNSIEGRVASDMVAASRAVGDRDLTPMAAVAGAIADAVADFLLARGMSRVVVSNGGDVAVRLAVDCSVQVGIGININRTRYGNLPTLVLDSSRPRWGVASSGLGGRSMTKGIASIVTVVSDTAARADAAATAVANATYVEDPEIKRVRAEALDPNTDIPGQLVTLKVGRISNEKIGSALRRGKARAYDLIEEGVISGALIVVKDRLEAIGTLFRLEETQELH